MIDSMIGAFKTKAEYNEAAQKAMAKLYFKHGRKRCDPVLLRIKDEYEERFGKTIVEGHGINTVSITRLDCGHVRYWEYSEAMA